MTIMKGQRSYSEDDHLCLGLKIGDPGSIYISLVQFLDVFIFAICRRLTEVPRFASPFIER